MGSNFNSGPGSLGRGIRMPAPQVSSNALHSATLSVRPPLDKLSDLGKLSALGDGSGEINSLLGNQPGPLEIKSGDNTTSGGEAATQK
jgi:hypothetical protein